MHPHHGSPLVTINSCATIGRRQQSLVPPGLCGSRVSQAYRKTHTPPQQPSGFSAGMNHNAAPPTPDLSTGKGSCS